MQRWSGRVAIVTGASSGIGAAIARLLAEHGMRVVGVARPSDCHAIQSVADELKTLEVEGELHALECDVTREEDVVRVVMWTRDNLGGADVLVNNAGVNFTGLLTEIASSSVRAILDTNVLGLCMFTREVIKDMRSRDVDDGHIFHICSATGQRILEYPGIAVYSGSKHAVRVLTEGLRRELRDSGTRIKVTSISPGIVRTDIAVNAGASREESDRLFRDNPCLDPIDVAHALHYALSTPPHVQVHELTVLPLGEKY